MAQYKTPGVYIQEISTFPPSIAAVDTALPAFIGYTAKAEREGTPLTLVPVTIHSLVEYERYFGGGHSPEVTLCLDAQNEIADARVSRPFYLYDSLRLFFNNGGGACMIVSAGDYSDEITHTALAQGLARIESLSWPTLIVMPEAVLLNDHGVSLYAAALVQCANLHHRMVICDLGYQAEIAALTQEAAHFRNHIGSEHLKYGAAYGPWLITTFIREPRLGTLVLKRKLNENGSAQTEESIAATALLGALTSDTSIKTKVIDVGLAERVCKLLVAGASRLINNAPTLEQAAADLAPDMALLTSSNISDYQAALGAQSRWFLALMDILSMVVKECPDTNLVTFSSTINSQAHTRMQESMRLLVAHHHALLAHTGLSLIDDTATCPLLGLKDQAAILALSPLPDVDAEYAAAATEFDRVLVTHQALQGIIRTAIVWFGEVQLSAETTARALNQDLYTHFSVFKSWIDRANTALNTLPASAAIAGVYAQMDVTRGVWKVPANVALQAVEKPVLKMTDQDQTDYNVHSSGKSINIIRTFAGKGTLVWGARTLAGNDNEWRYINVRRLFGMVEASIESGLQAYVFEANDANTWLKIKAAVENFLTALWKQGALMGSKPEQAFYVRAGLGETMTDLDMLEDRLIIEIGLAPVRPAEFIIYKSTLKMSKS